MDEIKDVLSGMADIVSLQGMALQLMVHNISG